MLVWLAAAFSLLLGGAPAVAVSQRSLGAPGPRAYGRSREQQATPAVGPGGGSFGWLGVAGGPATGGFERLLSGPPRLGPTGPTGHPDGVEPGCSGCTLIAQFSSIGCGSTTECTAVGSTFTGTLGEDWNGSSWAFDATKNFDTGSSLAGVWCTSATACIAVGDDGGGGLVAEFRNGATWNGQAIPPPSGATQATLNQVSCSSAGACTAVGYYATATSTVLPLAERWNGSSWTVQSVPTSGASVLNYVWCSSANPERAVSAGE